MITANKRTIPQDIILKAAAVSEYCEQQHITEWKISGCASRSSFEKATNELTALRAENERLKSQRDAAWEVIRLLRAVPQAKETEWAARGLKGYWSVAAALIQAGMTTALDTSPMNTEDKNFIKKY